MRSSKLDQACLIPGVATEFHYLLFIMHWSAANNSNCQQVVILGLSLFGGIDGEFFMANLALSTYAIRHSLPYFKLPKTLIISMVQ